MLHICGYYYGLLYEVLKFGYLKINVSRLGILGYSVY